MTSGARLILVRHAHRSTERGRELDNGLSPKGRTQAERVGRYFQYAFGKEGVRLLTSPAKRCQETLLPIARQTDITIEVSNDLAEQGWIVSSESSDQFARRIKNFCSQVRKQSTQAVIACSHGDWIPTCVELMTGHSLSLKKGGWIELRWDENKAKLWTLLQTP